MLLTFAIFLCIINSKKIDFHVILPICVEYKLCLATRLLARVILRELDFSRNKKFHEFQTAMVVWNFCTSVLELILSLYFTQLLSKSQYSVSEYDILI